MYTASNSASLTLACHPRNPSRFIRSIDVTLGLDCDGFTLNFSLVGDIPRLFIPKPVSPRRADNLWRHTCFEFFVMLGEGPGYREFNFSPSGEWAAYAYRGYRDGQEKVTDHAPHIEVRMAEDRLMLDATICRDCLPQAGALRVGLSAVVEDADGVLSYWALRHPPGKPDFHHADAFALTYGSRISAALRPE